MYWFSLLTLAATLLTAIAALATVLEMRRQRMQAAMAKVSLLPSQVQLAMQFEAEEVAIPIANVGAAVALAVRITFDVPDKEMLSWLSAVSSKTDFKCAQEHGWFSWNKPVQMSVRADAFRENVIPYLLPLHQSGAKCETVKLPLLYVAILRLYSYCVANGIGVHEIPTVDVSIAYRELSGRRHDLKLRVGAHVVAVVSSPTIHSFVSLEVRSH